MCIRDRDYRNEPRQTASYYRGRAESKHDGGKAYEALFRHRRGRAFRQDDTSRIIRHTKSCGVFAPQLLLLFFHIRLNICYIYSCDLFSALYDKDLFFFIISSVRLVYSCLLYTSSQRVLEKPAYSSCALVLL